MGPRRPAAGRGNGRNEPLERISVAPGLALGLILAAALYLRLAFLGEPIRYDEAYTFISYASLPSLEAISNYTTPNNHLLHTLLVKLSTSVFNPWKEWAIRLPALISGVLLVAAVFVFAFRQLDWQTGLWAAALTAVSSYLVEYSILGRGYTMVCLFTVLLLTASRSVVLEPRSKPGWIVFICASVAGMATIPTMIYPLCLATGWILLGADIQEAEKWKSLIRPLVISWFIILLGTLLWYTPAFLTTGLESVLANRYVQPLIWQEWLGGFYGLCQRLTSLFHRDLPLPMALLLTGGFLLGCFKTPKLVLASAFTVPGLMLLQCVVPEPRVFTFLLPVYLYLAATGLKEAVSRVLRIPGLNRRIITSAIFPLLWLLAASFFLLRYRGPSHSDETGIFPEAEKIVHLLAEKIVKSDQIWSWGPSDMQLKYYGLGLGLSLDRFDLRTPDNRLPQGVYNVLNLRYVPGSSTFSDAVVYKPPEVAFELDSVVVMHYILKDQAPYISEAMRSLNSGNPEMVPSIYVRLRKKELELTEDERFVWYKNMAKFKDRYNSLIQKQPGNAEALMYFICYHTVKNDTVKIKEVYKHILKYKFSPEEWLKFLEFASAGDQEFYRKAMLDEARRQHPGEPLFGKSDKSNPAAR